MSGDFQERTLTPSKKHIAEAKKRGVGPTSNDLNFLLKMLITFLLCYFFSGAIIHFTSNMMHDLLSIQHANSVNIVSSLFDFSKPILLFLSALCVAMILSALICNAALGGFRIETSQMIPNLERINPIAGLKRLFSLDNTAELLKSLFKFSAITVTCAAVIYFYLPEMINLGSAPTRSAVFYSLTMIKLALVCLIVMLVIFAVIDVPYQLWQTSKKLRMTYQEMKDESNEK